MDFTVIIPARFGSSRLPGKPLLDIHGQSMVQRVYLCAQKSAAAQVVVATDDERIVAAVEAFGGKVCLTSAAHQSGTDRLQEVVRILNLADDHVVVNVQGDEPLIPPEVINQVAASLVDHPDASASTLSEPIDSAASLFDPNVVKVVTDSRGYALYFSRAPIPWDRDHFHGADTSLLQEFEAQRHIGIYGYRVSLLHQFVGWEMAKLEITEKLEQLRLLANGAKIIVQQALAQVPGGIDTAEDLQRVRALFNNGGQ